MQKKAIFLLFIRFVVFSCLNFFQSSFSQTHSPQFINITRHLSVEDGLSSREVFCGLQDKKGFIWLGTRNGLNRYDGENFVVFSQKSGLRFNTIVQLTQPDSNELWIFYGISGFSKVGGNMVDIMNPNTNKITSFTKQFPNSPFQESEIIGMKSLGNSTFILLTLNGYYKYTPATKLFEKWFDKNAAPEYFLFSNNIFYHEYAWVSDGKNKMTCYQNGKPKGVFDCKNNLRHIIGIKENGSAITVDGLTNRNRFFLVTTNGEFHLDSTIQHLTKKSFQTSNEVSWIQFNAESNSAVMNSTALYCFENNNLFELLSPEEKSKRPDFVLYDYFVDQQKRKWICTSTGIIIFDNKQNHFQSLFNDSTITAFKKKFNQARNICSDESGNVYAGIGSSLCVCNSAGKTLDQFFPGNYFNDNGLHNNVIYGLLKDKKLYAGLTNDLLIFNSGFSKPELIKIDTLNEIWTLFRLDNNRIMGGCSFGYFIYDDRANGIVYSKQLPRMFLYRIIRDHAGMLWGAGASGLYQFEENGKIIKHFFSDASDPKKRIPFTDLMDLHIDSKGIFWLATNGDGLYRWDRSKNIFDHFLREDGLSSNLLYGILEDEYGDLWLSSDFGLNRFNKVSRNTTIYTTADGLNNNEFNRTSFYKADDGKMFFGGLNGVNAFYPKDFSTDSLLFNIPLQIISCNIFDGNQNKLIDKTYDILASQNITLQPGDAFFTLQFQLLDYELGKHRYAYRFDGIDKDWNYINENSIRISGLNYGNYTLHIKAQNPVGLWSTHEIKIAVTVIEPLTHRTWFRLLMIIVGAILVIAFIRYRFYRLSKDKEALEKTVELRTEQMRELLKDKDLLMKEIHHRVKNNLQVIGNLLEMQGENIPDEKLQNSFHEAQARVRSVALIHHNLYRQDELSTIEWKGFVDELAKSVASIFQPKGKSIEIKNSIPETFLDIDTAIPLGLILNELFTNSFKYAFTNTDSGSISIGLEVIDTGVYQLIYSDNGPGFKQDFAIQTSTSLGLRLIHRLTAQLMGEVKYKNNGSSEFIIQFKNATARKMEE